MDPGNIITKWIEPTAAVSIIWRNSWRIFTPQPDFSKAGNKIHFG